MNATRALRMQASKPLFIRPSRPVSMQPSRPMFRPMPKEEHSAHTISQRLRQLKKIPPELMPLGVVLSVAVGFAIYSVINKLFTDKTLRLHRTSRS